jgi:hypothetical protein
MQAPAGTSFLVLFGRLTWMAFGPFALFLMTYGIVHRGDGWLTPFDLGFFVVLGLMVLGRWVEFRGGDPQTASGEPATWPDFTRYVGGVLVVGLALWVGANLLANVWLAR